MKKFLLVIAALLLAASCTPQKRERQLPVYQNAPPTEMHGLDFEYKELWVACVRAVRVFFETHHDHRFFKTQDLDSVYPEKGKIKSWYVRITEDVPVHDTQFARLVTIDITPEGETSWQCNIRVYKCERPADPNYLPNEDWHKTGPPEIDNELFIRKQIHKELERIIERKRRGLPPLES